MSLQPSAYVTQCPYPVEEPCSICHEEITSGPIAGHQARVLTSDEHSSLDQSIYHIFHKSCLDQWILFQNSPSCPLCRMPITNINPHLEDLYVLIGIGKLDNIELFLSEQSFATEEIEKALSKALQYKKTDIALYLLHNCQMSQSFLDELLIGSIEQSYFAIAQWIIKNTSISKEARQKSIMKICHIPNLSYPEHIYMKMLRYLLQTGPIDQDVRERAVEAAKDNKRIGFANALLQ
jgi:hypothetical protein